MSQPWEEIEQLAAEFRELVHTKGDSDWGCLKRLEELEARCGQWIKRFARLLELPELPWPKPPTSPVEDKTRKWAMLWRGVIMMLQRDRGDEMPPNPLRIDSELALSDSRYGRAIEGQRREREWRYLAQNHAVVCDFLARHIEERLHNVGDGDPSAWVSANQLWTAKFSSNNELAEFREKHPEMFRNPSKYKLEIHAGLWVRYWAKHEKAVFEGLDGDLKPLADDPTAQAEAIREAGQRFASLRVKKRGGKQ